MAKPGGWAVLRERGSCTARRGLVALAVAVALALGGACSSSSPTAAVSSGPGPLSSHSGRPGTARSLASSGRTIRSGPSSSPTAAPSTSVRAEPPETGGDSTGGADTGGAPAAAGKTACELVTRADLVAAGVKGAIAKGKPLQSGIQDDKSSSVCSFDVTLGDLQTNVLVTVAAHGSPDLYDILADDFADVTHEIAGLGTKAEYTADARNLDSDSDHDFGDYSDQQVIVLQGSAVLLVQAPGSRVADEDSLTSLARTLARAAA